MLNYIKFGAGKKMSAVSSIHQDSGNSVKAGKTLGYLFGCAVCQQEFYMLLACR
jgi:hypothetical protein